ncbi:hypothetical protein E1176_11000 [Fulvivirga sp. RKSG066]|nr:hypothetical protein [Fulvivirga aurantia]
MKNINWKDHLVNLFVVIIGITVAFALNRFAENSKEQALEKEYLKSFLDDLNKDIEQLIVLSDTSTYWMKNNKRLTEVITSEDLSNDSLFYYVISLYSLAEFTAQDNTYETLRSSGNFYLLGDFNLRKDLTNVYNTHYKYIAYLDEYHRNLQMNKLSPYINENVRFTGRPVIANTEFLRDNYFINISFSALNVLQTKLKAYDDALEAMKDLKIRLENQTD